MAGFENFASSTSDSQSLLSGLSSAIKSRSTSIKNGSGFDSAFDNVLKGRQDLARDNFSRDAAQNRRNHNDNVVDRTAPRSNRQPEADTRPDPIDRSFDPSAKARPQDREASRLDRPEPRPEPKTTEVNRSAPSENPANVPEKLQASEDAAASQLEAEAAPQSEIVAETEVEVIASTDDQATDETILIDKTVTAETSEAAIITGDDQAKSAETTEEAGSSETTKTEELSPVKADNSPDTSSDQPEEGVVAEVETLEAVEVADDQDVSQTQAVQTEAIAVTQSISPELATEAAAKQGSTTSDTLAANAKKAADQAAAASGDEGKTSGSAGKDDPAATTNQRAASAEASVALKAAALAQKSQNPAARADTTGKITANAPTLESLTGTSPNGQSNAASATFKATTPPAQGSIPNLPVRSIALHIANKVADGITSFQIRLDPPELGRIDVKMKIAGDGQVTTHLTVDRPETLEALQRDQRGLERTLQNAGLDTEGGLSFDLRDETQAEEDGPNGGGSSPEAENGSGSDGSEELAQDGPVHHISLSAIDIRI